MATTHPDAPGPEIEGTRITVYTLLPHFLESSTTEADLCQLYDLTPEQVAAARAYILNNVDVVLGQHLQIEAKRSAGNPPEVVEAANRTRETLSRFREWLSRQEAADSLQTEDGAERARVLTFKQWLAERESRPTAGS